MKKTDADCPECLARIKCPTCGTGLFPANHNGDTFGYLCPKCTTEHFESLDDEELRDPRDDHYPHMDN